MTEQQIREHAERFRRCLEQIHPRLGTAFVTFPAGSCADSSKLLGQWLAEHGALRLMYVAAVRRGKSHAWLEYDELIIDITADQFEDGPRAVYVGKGSSFHREFKDEVRLVYRIEKELEHEYHLCKEWMRDRPKSL